jgi:hypothetical protein
VVTRSTATGVLIALLTFTAVACEPFSRADGTAAIRTTTASVPATIGTPARRTKAVEWVLAGQDEVIYLKWSAPGGAIAGVIQTARPNAARTDVKVTSGILAGAANGPHVVLRTGQQTWSGTVDGDALVLAITRPNGDRDELRFTRGTARDFDAAVDAIRLARVTTTTRYVVATTTTTASVQSTAPPPTPPEGPGPVLDALEEATSRLRELRSTDGVVQPTEGALDAMYASADEVYSAMARPRCNAARDALSRLDSAAEEVVEAVVAVEQRATEIETQRAVVMDAGMGVVALDDPALNSIIVATNEELARADNAASELRRYAGEVHAARAATTADAAAVVAAQC